MTDDQFAQMLGAARGSIRREVLAEIEALSGLVADLEQRIENLERGAHNDEQ